MTTKRTITRQRPPKNVQSQDDSRVRRQCIAEAAYYKAEKRGFIPGKEYDDWLEAEREFDSQAGEYALGPEAEHL